MSKNFTGGCACGAVRYECNADPMVAGHCHCRACQRASGAGHASHIMLPKAAMKITGDLKFYDAEADSGNMVSRGFCPNCGSPVLANNSGMAEMTAIRAASLDDPSLFEPILVVFTETAQPWDTVHEELPNFPQMPDMVPGV